MGLLDILRFPIQLEAENVLRICDLLKHHLFVHISNAQTYQQNTNSEPVKDLEDD